MCFELIHPEEELLLEALLTNMEFDIVFGDVTDVA
jgi:hypothetical protein